MSSQGPCGNPSNSIAGEALIGLSRSWGWLVEVLTLSQCIQAPLAPFAPMPFHHLAALYAALSTSLIQTR